MPTVGWGVLHLFCKAGPAGRRPRPSSPPSRRPRPTSDQVVPVAMLGHKADLAFMALGPDLWRLRRLQTELRHAGLDVVDCYVSLTELSEYAQGVPEEMKQARLHPQLPPEGKPAFCFYPMSKRRGDVHNWFTLPYDDRKELMYEHGASGRKFAGPGAPGRHRLDRPRRLRVGRHPLRRASRRPQGGRLHDALRRGVGPLRRVRPVLHGHGGAASPRCSPPSASPERAPQLRTRV